MEGLVFAMADYIDRNDALYAIERSHGTIGAYEEVECLPAADVVPVVHGKWITQDRSYTRFMCSACNSKNHRGGDKYCPNCGADMRGENNG